MSPGRNVLALLSVLAMVGLAVPPAVPAAASIPTPAAGEDARLVTNSETNEAGWVLFDGFRQWISKSCRDSLAAGPATVEIIAWAEIALSPPAVDLQTCGALAELFVMAPPSGTVLAAAGGTGAWYVVAEERHHMDAACVDALSLQGIDAALVPWQQISTFGRAAPGMTCEAILAAVGQPAAQDQLVQIPNNPAGWFLTATGTKQWLPPTCRALLEERGRSFVSVAYREFGSLSPAPAPLACNAIDERFGDPDTPVLPTPVPTPPVPTPTPLPTPTPTPLPTPTPTPLPTPATPGSTITGVVLGANDAPLQFAGLFLVPAAGGRNMSTGTDESGRFIFEGLDASAEYYLSVVPESGTSAMVYFVGEAQALSPEILAATPVQPLPDRTVDLTLRAPNVEQSPEGPTPTAMSGVVVAPQQSCVEFWLTPFGGTSASVTAIAEDGTFEGDIYYSGYYWLDFRDCFRGLIERACDTPIWIEKGQPPTGIAIDLSDGIGNDACGLSSVQPPNLDIQTNGFGDLVVGTGTQEHAHRVLYGSEHLSGMLRYPGSWSVPEGARFGHSLALYEGVVLYGAPGYTAFGIVTGSVRFSWGGFSRDLIRDAQYGPEAQVGDEFGYALATGDFNGDGTDEIAVGVPGRDVDGAADAGWVEVHLTLRNTRRTTHPQGDGLPGEAEAGDRVGSVLAAGDFNHDGYTDLAVGIPDEEVAGLTNAGEINVIYGGPDGLVGAATQRFDSTDWGLPGAAGDRFGDALAVADFNGDGVADLAIGAPGHNASGGLAVVLHGSADGPTTASVLTSALDEIETEPGDRFGSALAAGDFNTDGFAELAVATDPIVGGPGWVAVFAGAGSGSVTTPANIIDPESLGLSAAGSEDFAASISAGRTGWDAAPDLIIGVPGADIGGNEDAGMVVVIRGGLDGLQESDFHLVHRHVLMDRAGPLAGERFGELVLAG